MNGADFRSELTLPSHPDAIVLARAYARALATLAGLPPTELDALVDAVTTACADIVQNALAPGEVDALALGGVVTPSALTLAIRERGAPFDPTSAAAAAAETILSPVRGRDWERIGHAVDEAHWPSLGTDGIALSLTQRRPHPGLPRPSPAGAASDVRGGGSATDRPRGHRRLSRHHARVQSADGGVHRRASLRRGARADATVDHVQGDRRGAAAPAGQHDAVLQVHDSPTADARARPAAAPRRPGRSLQGARGARRLRRPGRADRAGTRHGNPRPLVGLRGDSRAGRGRRHRGGDPSRPAGSLRNRRRRGRLPLPPARSTRHARALRGRRVGRLLLERRGSLLRDRRRHAVPAISRHRAGSRPRPGSGTGRTGSARLRRRRARARAGAHELSQAEEREPCPLGDLRRLPDNLATSVVKDECWRAVSAGE